MDIDFPGVCLHNLDGAPGRESWTSDSFGFYGEYLFVLSFHNTCYSYPPPRILRCEEYLNQLCTTNFEGEYLPECSPQM
jgi:hypothetical protein